MRESCINHAPKVRSVVIKSDYLEICENDHCEAALLGLVEFWANGAIANRTKSPNKIELGQFTSKDLHWWLLGFYSTKRIMQRIDKLQERGFIHFEESANHKQRRYWAHIDVIQSALDDPRQMSVDKCLKESYPRQMSEDTPDKCLDKPGLPQTNVSTSIFSNSSLSNEELVSPLTPQGEKKAGEELTAQIEEPNTSDTASPATNPQATPQTSNATYEGKASAAPRDNTVIRTNNQPQHPRPIDSSERLPWDVPESPREFESGFERHMSKSLEGYSSFKKLNEGELLTKVRKHIAGGKHDLKRRDELLIEWDAYKSASVTTSDSVAPQPVANTQEITPDQARSILAKLKKVPSNAS